MNPIKTPGDWLDLGILVLAAIVILFLAYTQALPILD